MFGSQFFEAMLWCTVLLLTSQICVICVICGFFHLRDLDLAWVTIEFCREAVKRF